MSIKTDKIKQQLIKILNETIVLKISNVKIKSVQITDVVLSKDLSIAKVYYFVEPNNDSIQKALESSKSFFKRNISEAVEMRVIPDLIFIFDKTPQYAEKIEKLLSKIEYSDINEEELKEKYDKLDE